MKVMLTAFGGKLRSDVLEYPEEIGHRITIPMPIDGHKWVEYSGHVTLDQPACIGLGVFENTGMYLLVGKDTCKEYRLIDWKKH
ncbi:hypothetical protein EHM92_00165 [bacterium]|nr:MAG: hypothetical protein EHM92_00165 [bacterium]